MRVLAVVLASLAAAIPIASATTYFVQPDGTGDFPTIQSAVDAAADGDRIELTEGTFTGDGNRNVDFAGKTVTVASRFGVAESCVIDCEGSAMHPARGFLFISGEGPGSVIRGVTITHGYAWGVGDANYGGAICCIGSSPSIADCIFAENTGGLGAGISCYGSSSPRVSGCSFLENAAAAGGGIYCWIQSGSTLQGCRFFDNTASDGGAVFCYESSPAIIGCEFLRNTADFHGGAIWCSYSSSPQLEDCVLAANEAGVNGGAIRCYTNCSPTLVNCTLFGNSAPSGAGLWCNTSNTPPTFENTIVAFSTQGDAVHCEDGGLAALYCCDVYGNAGGDWIGCLEGQWGVDGNIALDPLFCDPENNEFGIHHSSPCAPEHNPACGLLGAAAVACGDVCTVNPGGTGDFPTIQAAIDAAQDWDVIELTDGTFRGDGNRDIEYLDKSITVRSQSGDPLSCVIDCEGTEEEPHRGIAFLPGDQEAARLEGVTIRHGYAPDGRGGAIYLSACSPAIINCVLASSIADYGGALYCGNLSRARVEQCTVMGNSAAHGGGANCDFSLASFINCTFYANATHGPGPGGAGVECWNSAAPVLENTIIAYSTSGRAVVCHDIARPTLTCCDLYGNAEGDWVGPCIGGQYGRNGNISLDPCFCDAENGDYHLWNYSPCAQVGCGLIGAWPVGCWDPMAVEPEPVPQGLSLSVWPNPVGGAAQIRYMLPTPGGQVRLGIYDLVGRLARSFAGGAEAAGSLMWDGTDCLGRPVGSGAYFLRLRVGEEEVTRRVVVVK